MLGGFLPFNALALLLGKLILLALIRLQLLGHRLFTLGHVVSLLLSEVIRLLLAVLLSQFPQALIAAATQLGLADLHTVDFCQALLMGEAQLVQLTGELHVQGTETGLPLLQHLFVVSAGITGADRLRGLVLGLLTNPEALLAIRLLNPVYLGLNLGAALLELRQGSAARRVAQNGIEQADAAECLLFRRLFDLVIQILEFVTQVPEATAHAVNGAWVVGPTIEQSPPVADGIAELFGQPVDLIRCPQHALGERALQAQAHILELLVHLFELGDVGLGQGNVEVSIVPGQALQFGTVVAQQGLERGDVIGDGFQIEHLFRGADVGRVHGVLDGDQRLRARHLLQLGDG
ncbi:hypothetical protein D3C85_670620 [compost metagenome]